MVKAVISLLSFSLPFMSNGKKNETIWLEMQSYIEFPLGLERTKAQTTKRVDFLRPDSN